VLPVWELNFGDVTEDGKRIATAAVKHDIEYQQRHNVTEGPAKGLAPETIARIQRLAKRICRTLELDGYSRIDFRLAEDGTPYFIEANPNPEIAKIEEFARAAAYDGIKYWALLERICQLGISRTRAITEEAPIAP
jgi:D-alanine-D-alanine ligase